MQYQHHRWLLVLVIRRLLVPVDLSVVPSDEESHPHLDPLTEMCGSAPPEVLVLLALQYLPLQDRRLL